MVSNRPRDAATLLPHVFGRIASAAVYTTQVPLRRPLGGASSKTATRTVRVLALRADDDAIGYGEASVVDWLGSGASAAETETALQTLVERIAQQRPQAASLLRGSLDPALPSAVRCALQTALLDLQARRREQTLAGFLGAADSCPVLPLAALIGDATAEEMAREAASYAALGINSFKVKVGGRELAEDQRRVLAVREAIGNGAKLRLDANRAWDLATAQQALAELAVCAPEFLEEPCQAGENDPLGDPPIRIAVDESVSNADDLTRAIERGDSSVLVIKLERVGGPLVALALAQTAVRNGLEVVFTDSIEGAVGRAATAQVAAAAAERAGTTASAIGLGGLFLLEDGQGPAATLHVHGPGLGISADNSGAAG